jgi:hypothetical protein
MLRMCKHYMVLYDDSSFEPLSRVLGGRLVCCTSQTFTEMDSRLTLVFLLRSCSNCSGERGTGRWYLFQAKEDHSLERQCSVSPEWLPPMA